MLVSLFVKARYQIATIGRAAFIIGHDRPSPRDGRGLNEESRWLAVHPRSLTRRNDFYVVELSSPSYSSQELIMAETFLTALVRGNIRWKSSEELREKIKK